MKATKHETGTMEERLAGIGRRVDRLVQSTHHALDRTSEQFQKEWKRIDEHMSAARAQIRQDLARTRDDFVHAAEDELDVWKGRLDELNLQKTLGTMQLRDRLTPVLDRASIAIEHARRRLQDLTEDSFEEEVKESIQQNLGELRSEIANAEEFS